MQHELRVPVRKDLAQLGEVAHVADEAHELEPRVAGREFLLEGVEVELAEFDEHEALRRVARELAAELAADAAAGAGDEHGGAAQDVGDAGFVELHRRAPEQVLGLDAAQALEAAAFAQLLDRRHGEHGQAGVGGELERAAALLGGGRGQRDDDVRGGAAQHRVGDGRQRPEHAHVADARALLARVVVEQAQHRPALFVDACEHQARRRSGAHDDRAPRARGVDGRVQAQLLPQHAVDDAHEHEAHQRDERMQRQHGARHLAQAQPHHQRRGQRADDEADEGQPSHFGKAREAPQALRQPRLRQRQQVEQHDAGEHRAVVAGARAEPALETQAKEVGEIPGEDDDHGIDDERQHGAVRPQAREQRVQAVPGCGRRRPHAPCPLRQPSSTPSVRAITPRSLHRLACSA